MEITQIIFGPESDEKGLPFPASIRAVVRNNREGAVEIPGSTGPRGFFENIARAVEHPFCLLMPPSAQIDFKNLREVLRAMAAQRADLAIARVKDAQGRQTVLPRRIEELRFSSLLPPGTAVFTREHFTRTARNLPDRPWDPWWHFDFIRTATAHGLVCLSDRVIATVPDLTSSPSRAECLVPLTRPADFPNQSGDSVIVIYGALEASVSLYFEGLPRDLQRQIRFLSPSDPQTDLSYLALASAVIIVRDFEHLVRNGLVDILQAMEVPLFWFTDDHFGALRSEYAAFRYYDPAAMQAFLSQIRGILVSTPQLAEIYEKQHGAVILWPCVFDESLATAPSPETDPFSLRIGAFGGGFRRKSLQQEVMPEIRRFRSNSNVSLHVRSELARGLGPAEAVPMPFDSSYRQFVFRWQRLGLHTVVHPSGATANIACKSRASLLTARYLGAVPIVAAEPSHAEIGEDQGVLVAGKNPGAWESALEKTRKPDARARLFGALDLWCRDKFNPEKSREPFLRLAAMLPPAVDAERRLSRALLHPKWKGILASDVAAQSGRTPSLLKKIRKWHGWKRLDLPFSRR